MRTLPNERLGPADSTQGPERKCILSGAHAARDSLIRLAISPDGEVLPDVRARAPGRGAWIGVSRTELENAIVKGNLRGALARAFRGAALTIPADLGELIEAALLRDLTDRLGLEMRTGAVLFGSERIAEAARGGAVEWLGHAADAAEDGSRKLDQAWRVGSDAEGTGQRGVRLPLDRAALSVALGRENIVHLAVTDPKAAQRIAVPLARYLLFSGRDEATEQAGGERRAASADASRVTATGPAGA